MAHFTTTKICSQCKKNKPWSNFTMRRNPSGTLVPKNPCKICRAEKAQKDPKRAENQKRFYERNPDYQRKWKEANREHLRKQAKERRESNLIRERKRANQWQREHPWVSVRNAANRRARKRNQFIESINPLVVFDRDKGICGICKKPVSKDDFHVDHVIPISKGGLHCYANVQSAHPFCNMSKHNKVLPNVN